jgi:hypothetical protein
MLLRKKVLISILGLTFLSPLAWFLFALSGEGARAKASHVSMSLIRVAVYEMFMESGRSIPVIREVAPAENDYHQVSKCFLEGMPNPHLKDRQACNSEIFLDSSNWRDSCVWFRREQCSVVSISQQIATNPRFLEILRGYSENVCQFLRAYDKVYSLPQFSMGSNSQRLPSMTLPSTGSLCTPNDNSPTVLHVPQSEVWNEIRPFIVVRGQGDVVTMQIELRLRFPPK